MAFDLGWKKSSFGRAAVEAVPVPVPGSASLVGRFRGHGIDGALLRFGLLRLMMKKVGTFEQPILWWDEEMMEEVEEGARNEEMVREIARNNEAASNFTAVTYLH